MTGFNAAGAQATDFTIGGTTLTATAVTGAGTNLNGALTFTDGVTHVLFSDVVATGGSITFSTSTAERAFVLSGLQIEQVPEPSAVALFGLAGLGLILRRRR